MIGRLLVWKEQNGETNLLITWVPAWGSRPLSILPLTILIHLLSCSRISLSSFFIANLFNFYCEAIVFRYNSTILGWEWGEFADPDWAKAMKISRRSDPNFQDFTKWSWIAFVIRNSRSLFIIGLSFLGLSFFLDSIQSFCLGFFYGMVVWMTVIIWGTITQWNNCDYKQASSVVTYSYLLSGHKRMNWD